MHIPDGMLNGAVCPVTAALSAVGVGVAAVAAWRQQEQPGAARFGAVTALIFAGQMINFPIQSGTSGHLLGGVLAVALLGLPHGILAMALVVAVQCLAFADGGLGVLGANVFNMALIGAGLGGLLLKAMRGPAEPRSAQGLLSTGVASWLAVMLAALAVTAQLALAGTAAFGQVAVAMLGTHAIIGFGEALITAALVALLATSAKAPATGRRGVVVPLLGAGVVALLLSPLASAWPDGLEWVAREYGFLHDQAPRFVTPLADYSLPVLPAALGTGLAGIIGVALCFGIAWGCGRLLSRRAAA